MTKRKRKKRQNGGEPINIHLVSPVRVVVSRRPRVPISAGRRLLLYSISSSSRAYSRLASSSLSPSFLLCVDRKRTFKVADFRARLTISGVGPLPPARRFSPVPGFGPTLFLLPPTLAPLVIPCSVAGAQIRARERGRERPGRCDLLFTRVTLKMHAVPAKALSPMNEQSSKQLTKLDDFFASSLRSCFPSVVISGLNRPSNRSQACRAVL